MTIRELTMYWWNSLSFEKKWEKIVKHKHLITGYPYRDPDSLTGREIEELATAEINHITKQ